MIVLKQKEIDTKNKEKSKKKTIASLIIVVG